MSALDLCAPGLKRGIGIKYGNRLKMQLMDLAHMERNYF